MTTPATTLPSPGDLRLIGREDVVPVWNGPDDDDDEILARLKTGTVLLIVQVGMGQRHDFALIFANHVFGYVHHGYLA